MTSNPSDRAAIVTGGSDRVARRLQSGSPRTAWAFVIHYAGNPAPAKDVLTAITTAGGTASMFQADVADGTEVAKLFDHAEQTYGGVDIVVHTAGIQS
jgi:3-oxoacyl-[acyl-carrier protein] reductase